MSAPPVPFTLVPIAETGERFLDFAPYVASVGPGGTVAFQATLAGGRSGVFTGAGGPITTVVETGAGPLARVVSHPDIQGDGTCVFYGELGSGAQGLFLARDGQLARAADTDGPLGRIGPLGPTMNEGGEVAFRADARSGESGIYTFRAGAITAVADTRGPLAAFHGLPVVTERGAVVFRADRRDGTQVIHVHDPAARSLVTVADTSGPFRQLGLFPGAGDDGTVVFCATLADGGAGVFAAFRDTDDPGAAFTVAPLADTRRTRGPFGPFESFRGALVDGRGTLFFYATPAGGGLGLHVSRPPHTAAAHVLSVGEPLFGSTVSAFALNPVSVNAAGQLAIRVELASGKQRIIRADPTG